MVKKVLSISVLLLFLAVTFQEASIVFMYKLNKDYIAEKFCVNKEVETSTCEGKCHLNQFLNESRKVDHKESIPPIERIEILAVVESNISLLPQPEFKELFTSYSDSPGIEVSNKSFRPPPKG